jgi:hypothetical protein
MTPEQNLNETAATVRALAIAERQRGSRHFRTIVLGQAKLDLEDFQALLRAGQARGYWTWTDDHDHERDAAVAILCVGDALLGAPVDGVLS